MPTNVYFKKGTQSALDSLIAANKAAAAGSQAAKVFKSGAFYLTSDTNRLYFAQDDEKLAELNQFIHVWTESSLPTLQTNSNLKHGDFYYWEPNNILAVYLLNATTNEGSWVQINPDTRLLNTTNAVSISDGGDSSLNMIAVTTTVQESNRNNNLSAGRSATGSFTLKGGANVHLTVDQDGYIVITADNDHATSYVISTTTGSNNTGNLNLAVSGSNSPQTIHFVGQGGTSITSDNNGNINISTHSDISSIEHNFDSNGILTTQIGFSGNENAITSTGITPTITYGDNGSASATFESDGTGNPTAILDVYTASEIDTIFANKEATFDGMTYKGVLTSTSDASTKLNASDVKPGFVYKAGVALNISGLVSAEIGDLVIAEQSGTSENPTITWVTVPSGNDQFINFIGDTTNKALSFQDHYQQDSTVGSIQLVSDTTATNAKIDIAASGSGTNNKDMVFTFSHGNPGTGVAQTYAAASSDNGRIQSTGTALTIPTIASISKDAQGHITSLSTVNYQITDTHAQLADAVQETQVANNIGAYGINLTTDDLLAHTATITLKVTSDNLKVSRVTPAQNATDDTLKINLEWESFT